jgi:hypothetical protein
MKKLLKVLVLLIVVGGVAAGVASYVSKKKLSAMSDDEIREFLSGKLSGRMGEDQVTSIQDAVISGVRSRNGSSGDHYVEDVKEAVVDLKDVAEDAADEANDAASDVADSAKDAVEDAAKS